MTYNVSALIKEHWHHCAVMTMLHYDGAVKKKKKHPHKSTNLESLVLLLVRAEYEVHTLISNATFLLDGMFILLIYKVLYVIGYNL